LSDGELVSVSVSAFVTAVSFYGAGVATSFYEGVFAVISFYEVVFAASFYYEVAVVSSFETWPCFLYAAYLCLYSAKVGSCINS